jgi:GNAT superfamily N-acetyltransferase
VSELAIVRRVTGEDYSNWLPLWHGYNAFYGRQGPTALDERITRTTWERFFDDHEPVYALVAVSAGRLLGLAHFLFHRNTTMLEPTCYMQDLFTVPTARGQGVGRMLINAVYDEARAAGLSVVYWQTHETNLTAMKLYDRIAVKSGFVVYCQKL